MVGVDETSPVMNRVVPLDCDRISDRPSFHRAFAETFGFPAFYGANGDAWIDCMTHPGEMTGIGLHDEDVITIRLLNSASLKARCPELHADIFELAAFVNFRRVSADEPGRICVSAAAQHE